jgi:hypothetical protein
MKNRSILVFLITLLVLSAGFNIVLIQKNIRLNNTINKTQSYVSDTELRNIQQEIEQLSKQKYIQQNSNNIQYDVKTKKPISNF